MGKNTLTFIIFLFAFLCNAQKVSGYAFSQSTETYVAVNGSNSTATGDDGAQDAIPITFPFSFGGVDYTTFSISTNGFIRLGNNIGDNNWANDFANDLDQAPVIAVFWDDNNRNTGAIQYQISGIAPNRTLEVGWNLVNIGNGGNTSATSASFKVRLYETTGQIDLIYGGLMNWTGNLTASIGLNDTTSFLSVTPASGGATASSLAPNNAISTTVDVIGKKYTFMPAPMCSGTPNPGNTVSSLTSICPDHQFTLSMPTLVAEYGLSYQWQSSTNGTDFTDIDGATTSELLLTQDTATYYQCNVTCSGNTASSEPILVNMNAPTMCYCYPSYAVGKTDGDLISNVVITGTSLSNNTGTAPVNPYYTYFTGQPNYTAELQVGINYEIQVTVGSYGQQNSAVWIDYNDDNVFSEDEKVGYTDAEVDSFGTATYNIFLDCSAIGGVHRMRIRDVYDTPGITLDPCANYGWGETEDYDITIIAASTCSPSFDLGTVYVNAYNAQLEWSAGCGQVSWDVHLTLAGGGLPSGTPSFTNVTENPFIVSGLLPDTIYDFYVLGHCGANGDSAWVGPFTFTTGPEPVGNDECETATTLTPGGAFEEHAVTTTNAGATKSLGPPNPTCAVFGFGGDVWFSIVVPTSGNVTVETQADIGSPLIDTGMTLFSGDCTLLTTLGCSDDEGNGAFSKLSLTGLMPGSTIYARVWEYANDTFGTFRVSAWDASLGNGSFDMEGFSYYPNPVKNVLSLSYTSVITEVKVFNLLGQQVLAKTIGSDIGQIDMSALSKGAYLVKVMADKHVKTIKVIKE